MAQMQTKKLYFDDSYLTEFRATVVQVTERNGCTAVVLDRTAFYPTSGGQMHDTGQLGQAMVTDVILENGQILHLVRGDLQKGPIAGRIDWQRRFDFMQQHTAFHILAQSFLRLFGCETISSHLGEALSTIDVQIQKIDWEMIKRVEQLANSIIWQNRTVRAFLVDKKELDSLPVRKGEINENPVRLVEIHDFDLDPCGGTHVGNTAEVGLVKILAYEKIRDCLRFTFVAGQRAYKDYATKQTVLQELGSLFSTGQEEIVHSAQKALDLSKHYRKQVNKLQERLVEYEADKLIKDSALQNGIVVREYSEYDMGFIRRLAGLAIKKKNITLLLGCRSATESSIVFATSQDVDLRQVFSQVQDEFGGRGGGKPDFIQAGGGSGNLSLVLNKAREVVVKQLEKMS